MRAIIIVFLLVSVALEAQEIKAGRTRQIQVKGDEAAFLCAVSPDGKQLLVSGPGYKGIYLISNRGGRGKQISDAPGAGFEPRFSDDGKYLFFRSDEFSEGRKVSSLHQYEVSTGEKKLLADRSRNLASVAVTDNNLRYSADGESHTIAFSNAMLKSGKAEISVILEDLIPVLYTDGVRKPLKPNGEGSYIWVSLSPDRTMLLYYFTGKGAFVSDLEGRVIHSAGLISAPKWLDNNIIIGMDDKDDGYRVTSSELVCFSLRDAKKTTLTSTESRAEIYPVPFPDGRSVAFQTPVGEVFIMKLKIR